MKRLILNLAVAFGVFATLKISAQNLEWVYSMRGSNNAGGISKTIQDNFGNLIIAGTFGEEMNVDFVNDANTFSTLGYRNAFFGKYGPQGQMIWAKQIRHTATTSQGQFNIEIFDVAVASDGSIYLTGGLKGTADFDPSSDTTEAASFNQNRDAFLVKYNQNGNLLWVKTFGENGDEFGIRIQFDPQGGLYLMGKTTGGFDLNDSPDDDYYVQNEGNFIVQLNDNNGSFLRALTLYEANWVDFAFDSAGNIIYAGSFTGTIDVNPGSDISDMVNQGNQNTPDVAVVKLNSDFQFIRAYQIGGDDIGSVGISFVRIDGFNDIYVMGAFSNRIDFEVPLAGGTLNSGQGSNVYICKLNSNLLSVAWYKRFFANGMCGAEAFHIGPGNNLYLSASFNGTIYVTEQTSSTSFVDNGGGGDGLLVKMTSAGAISWSGNIGGNGTCIVKSLVTANNEEIYASGLYDMSNSTNIDFDPNTGVYNLTITGIHGFVMKLNTQITTSISKNELNHDFEIFPNPSHGNFNIKSDKPGMLEISDISGKSIAIIQTSNTIEQIKLDLPKGVYFLKDIQSNKTRKIMIQ